METSLKRIRLKRKFSVGRHCIMSDVSMGRENIAVPVFNDLMDGAVIDVEFSYSPSFENLSNLLHHEMNTRDENFVMVADLSLGCHCDENCGLNCPCASSNVYTAHGSLSSEAVEFAAQGALETIVECCSSCRCSQRCGNRIAQRGLKAKLEIFRTRDRGWGVRTSSLLRKGEFICEYVGEVISSEEECNRDDDSYFFEITDTFLSFTVDSKFCGNVSRFINHSCQANIVMARVVWDTNSVHVPHLCLFALHDISAGEELTFDYGDRWWKVKSKIQCKCGSARCRYLRLDLPCDSRRK
ncbi:hypothetical protein AB6A40_005186 [Gnathostoma spinigerum]|uniref:Uncharacterized protein n=1 Tax=Gnathostoma spinigerum TaxID=75299 RepID=A0ABD6EGX2_9BILA